MAEKVHEFKVGMTCDGCSSAVQRVLDRLKGKGVNNVEISLENQTVKVTSTLPSNEILEVIKKTGKPVEYIKSS